MIIVKEEVKVPHQWIHDLEHGKKKESGRVINGSDGAPLVPPYLFRRRRRHNSRPAGDVAAVRPSRANTDGSTQTSRSAVSNVRTGAPAQRT